MTFLFCDVRAFTAIAERFKANPQGLTKLLNNFLTPMTDIILSRRGTIDKYMGDCIMAFWNAPLDDAQHSEHACSSALEMVRALDALNLKLQAEPKSERMEPVGLRIGIGINTGECVVGNMGSDQRFDYSVLGDAVNLASRLEGRSKAYGVDIVVSETTRNAIPDWAAVELDLIAVKGKSEAIRIFTLLGDAIAARSESFKHFAIAHQSMLEAYRHRCWDQARIRLNECREIEPRLAELYNLYASRIEEFSISPPAPDWIGVYIATEK
jgi:adenylate cyclase